MHRKNVAAASGMVSVQAHCTPDQALDLMTEYAIEHGQSVQPIATAVVERVLRFDPSIA